MKKLMIVLFCGLFFAPIFTHIGSANAGVYKWTDKDGNVHYGDQPVLQQTATELDINTNINTKADSGFSVSADKKKARDQLLEEFKEDREARNKKRNDKRIAKKKIRKQCARARDSLKRYREASGVYKLNKKGERVFYSKEARAKKERAYNKAIKKHCR
jgi:hypothetical protein